MPRWLKTLSEWLEQIEADDQEEQAMEEVIQWYQGWKQFIPERIRESSEIEEIMRLALEMIHNKLEQ